MVCELYTNQAVKKKESPKCYEGLILITNQRSFCDKIRGIVKQ